MKATDFNLAKEIRFDLSKGLTTFRETRLLVFDANAIGLLRNSVIQALGWEKARDFFFRFGYQHGFSDFLQMKTSFEFDSELELLASGPVIHTFEGLVRATPTEIRYNREKGEFYFTGRWDNSYEAEQHLCYHNHHPESVCWTLTGYASGWCTGFFGTPVVAMEPTCVGKGDSHCGWLIQPPDAWGPEAKPFIDALSDFWTLKTL